MKLKNILITVNNMEQSIAFYHDLFGLEVILRRDGNVILTEGLVLQDTAVWKDYLQTEVIPNSNACELYFEETDIESFKRKLEAYREPVQYAGKQTAYGGERNVLRFYDPNGHMIEVGTPILRNGTG